MRGIRLRYFYIQNGLKHVTLHSHTSHALKESETHLPFTFGTDAYNALQQHTNEVGVHFIYQTPYLSYGIEIIVRLSLQIYNK